jgi:hypothetical protein
MIIAGSFVRLTIDRRFARLLLLTCGFVSTTWWARPALAQEAVPSRKPAATTASTPSVPKPHRGKASNPEACGPNAATYWADSGPRVHVVRRGAITESKPFEPESAATESVVLEVRINDKAGTAYGPSFDKMHRAGPPSQLEEEIGSAIRRSSNLAGLSLNFDVVSEDGPEVVARLRFEGCGSVRLRPTERNRPARKPEPTDASPRERAPGVVPQGAIQ